MLFGAIIGERDGGYVYLGEPGRLDKVKEQFRALVKAGGDGCSQIELLSQRGIERRARFNPHRRKPVSEPPAAPEGPVEPPTDESPEPTETLGEVVETASKPGKKPGKKPKKG